MSRKHPLRTTSSFLPLAPTTHITRARRSIFVAFHDPEFFYICQTMASKVAAAAVVGISDGAGRVRLHRAKDRLRDQLQQPGERIPALKGENR